MSPEEKTAVNRRLASLLPPRRLPLLVGRFRALGSFLAVGALLAGCAGEPTLQTGPDAETIMDGKLARVDNTASQLAYLDPTADYARYRRVYIAPLDVDDIEIIQPNASSSAINRYNREWELNDEDRRWLRDTFRASMEKTISEGGAFEITDGGGDDVIVVEAMITQIAPAGPRDDMQTRSVPRSRVYSEGAGGMSIAIAIADGDSGEILALIKDTRNSSNASWGVNNRVTNQAEVRRNFDSWGRRLHDGLLRLRAAADGAEAGS